MISAATTTNELETEIPWWVADAINDQRSRVIAITGGLGSGKSYGAALWFFHRFLLNDQSPLMWAVAPTHAKVDDILLPTLQEVLYSHFGYKPDIHYEIKKSRPIKLEFYHGRQIVLLSGDRPELFVGANIAGYWLSEPGLQSREVFERLETRARCPKARLIQGIVEGTPEGDNWYKDTFDIDEYDAQNKYRRITLHTTDNKHLPPDYISRLEQTYAHDRGRLQSYTEGAFVNFHAGNCYKEFIQSRNISLDLVADEYKPLLMCWDFNHSPLAWVVMQHQAHETRRGRWHRYAAIQESTGDASQIVDSCAEFMARFPPAIWHDTPIELYGDNSGWSKSHKVKGSDFERIQKYLQPYYKRVTICASRSNIGQSESVEQINKLCMYEQLVVAAWCKNLIRSLSQTSWKPGTRDIAKPAGDKHTHWSDAIRPALFQLTKDLNVEQPIVKPTRGMNLW